MPDLLSSQWLPMFWLILAIVLGVIEAATVQLVAIWWRSARWPPLYPLC